MMLVVGSCLAHPFRADARGTLATVSEPTALVRQSVLSILSTRAGERVMMPDYGIPDLAFEVMDIGFAGRVAYFLEEQIRKYEPLVTEVRASAGSMAGGGFDSRLSADAHLAAVRVQFRMRDTNAPHNLVFPLVEIRR
ncbi:MAG TPA: GPW/gp25 family protein [Pyrinomonadaceae bacterium]|nr:GPW/gp25 family protein [Pyrinomonadaceae bacterium]